MECKYKSTKFYNQLGPCVFRQWKADSHCSLLHGYALSFLFEFESDTLDVRNWVMDYGGLKPLKDELENWFDHTLLVAHDDPEHDYLTNLHNIGVAKVVEVEKTGCEGIADFLYEWINESYLPSYGADVASRIWCCKVEVRETDANMAMRVGHRVEGCGCDCKKQKVVAGLKEIANNVFVATHQDLPYQDINGFYAGLTDEQKKEIAKGNSDFNHGRWENEGGTHPKEGQPRAPWVEPPEDFNELGGRFQLGEPHGLPEDFGC